jgi:hypothetical protein
LGGYDFVKRDKLLLIYMDFLPFLALFPALERSRGLGAIPRGEAQRRSSALRAMPE